MTTEPQREEMMRRLILLKSGSKEEFNKIRSRMIDEHFVNVVYDCLINYQNILRLTKGDLTI